MRQTRLAISFLWFVFLPWLADSVADEPSADSSREIDLPEDPSELAQQLVGLSRAKFDLHCKTFGVQEVMGMFDLAHSLRMATERRSSNEGAQLAAAEDLHRQLEELYDAVESCYQGTDQPIIDRELLRYRVQQTAALVAEIGGNKTTQLECTQRACTAAADLQRALMLAYEADAIPWNDMFAISWYHCEAKIALINLTTLEPVEAANDRAVAIEELLHLSDRLLGKRNWCADTGRWHCRDLEWGEIECSRIAARLARERGNREEEIIAHETLVAASIRRRDCFSKLLDKAVLTSSEFNKARLHVEDAELQLEEARARHKLEDFSREGTQSGSDVESLELKSSLAMVRSGKLDRECGELQRGLFLTMKRYSLGGCDALAVIEAAVCTQLVSTSLEQCRSDLEEIHAELRKTPSTATSKKTE
jgi:hypothetical protein